jgi:signal peptidase I
MINGPRMKTTKQNKKQLSGGFFKDIVSRENIEAIVIAVVLALVIRTFIVQAFKIPSGSMEPTLLIGDHILVNKFIYGITIPFTEKKILQFKKPQRGDVIVFIFPEDPSKDFIKRVIAVEGDQLAIRDKKVFINGQPASDPHAVYRDPTIIRGWGGEMSRDNFGAVTVPPHALFVMGDNRDKSYDSRFWGYVDLNKVRGRAFLIYWSWGGLFQDFRWNRIGNIIH